MSVNKAIIIGNLGADPELKYLPSGQAVCELRICTNEKWTDKQGHKQEKAEWHAVQCWGKTAENAAKYLSKGRQVYVEGRIATRNWEDKTSGEKRYKTEIVAQQLTFLGGGSGSGSGQRSESSGQTSSGGGDDLGPPPGSDDDLPF